MSTENTNDDPTKRAYHEVLIPNDKPKSEWSVNERRAYILQNLRGEWATLNDLPVTELAREFSVSRQTIWKDKQVLQGWIKEHLDLNYKQEAFETFTFARDKLLEDGEYRDATRVMKDWVELLSDIGEIETEPDEVKVTGTGSQGGLSIDFNVVQDGEDEEDAHGE